MSQDCAVTKTGEQEAAEPQAGRRVRSPRRRENRRTGNIFTDARGAGDGEQENGIGQENRNRDAARGDGEQENGIRQENK